MQNIALDALAIATVQTRLDTRQFTYQDQQTYHETNIPRHGNKCQSCWHRHRHRHSASPNPPHQRQKATSKVGLLRKQSRVDHGGVYRVNTPYGQTDSISRLHVFAKQSLLRLRRWLPHRKRPQTGATRSTHEGFSGLNMLRFATHRTPRLTPLTVCQVYCQVRVNVVSPR
ncbi:hypothetical protein CPAR01_00287 [Colletotrichum paranaense]|uniref:Uncharacterized protein n=1 Tax=Colletotrichum paranaense TaxID=1914294 RepID=A0ABQ9T3Y3_9PEZI|nr:uncharacterized protein CPAR01_00287 [Colletotrichum paranaense]KAK1546320.1 hypothetical protein CPAR01_00287 [Colletotrichum paranaense]